MEKEQMILIASATAHRACCGCEDDPENGKLHGYCIVCGVPWPCETAKLFINAPSAQQPLSSSADATPKSAEPTLDNGERCTQCLF